MSHTSDTQKFMAVAFTESRAQERSVLPRWPQHITLFPWAEGDIDKVVAAIENNVVDLAPITVNIAGKGELGTKHDVPAWLLEPQDVLRGLHNALLGSLREAGAVVRSETGVGPKYNPHITEKPGQPTYQPGDELYIDRISLVEQKPAGYKHVYRQIDLVNHDQAAA
jgi:hypothetical protein